jgi:hypothetical protein
MDGTTQTDLVDGFGVDFRRPVFAQFDDLGDRYWDWVHETVGPARRQALTAHDPAAPWPGSFRVLHRVVFHHRPAWSFPRWRATPSPSRCSY